MLNWYAVHAKPRQEAVAEINLQRQGFETYAPKIQVRKRKRDKWVKAVEPLFPRYLFIQVDPEQHSLAPVRSTLGVAGLVRFGQLLRPVPDTVISYLKQMENPETHQYHADEWPHKPGDSVQVLAGPFAGLPAVFQAASGEDRAMLLIDLLGRQNSVVVGMAELAASA
jgi:transcriptional antiterminator RfaH